MTAKHRAIALATAIATLGTGLIAVGPATAADVADTIASDAQSSQIEVGPSWTDTNGNLVEAHGGAATKYNESDLGIDITGDGDTDDEVYLLYGEKKTNATRPVDGINGYWSTDLETWHYMGNVLTTHNVLPHKVISITGEEHYTDYDSQQYFVDHKISQDGKTSAYASGSQKYTVLDEANLQELKDLANSDADTEDAKSARAFIKPYVTATDASGKATAYDEESLKIGFEYLYGMYNIVERPKVVYNKTTKKFVAIFHSDGSTNANADRINWVEGLTKSGLGVTGGKEYFEKGVANNDTVAKNTGSRYSRAQIGYAVSDSPFGPFKMVNSTRMNFDKAVHPTRFGESRDMTVFVDYGHDVNGDGVYDAYAVYSSEMNAKMYISLLNSDYTGPIVEGDSKGESDQTWRSRVLPDNSREASALFYWDGWYYMITSGTDGWNSTPVIYYRAKSVLQDATWEKLGNPFTGDNPSKGYDSQPTYVLVKDQEKGQFIYMGDRWVVDSRTGSAGQNSKLIWLPIELKGDDTINISGRTSWDPFDESLYTTPKDYGSLVLERGSLLPDKLTINGAETAVTWPDGANASVASAAAGTTLSLIFTAGGIRYNASVQIIAPGLVYFIDSGAKDDASATEYAAVKAAVKGLKNQVPDQATDGSSWGYVNKNVALHEGATKDETGLYTNNNGAVISYKLPLEAGSYTIDAGFYDWWAKYTDKRTVDLTVADESGTTIATGGKVTITNNKAQQDTTGTVSFTLDKAQIVTFSVTRASDATADPVLSWITVAQQSKDLGLVGATVSGELPKTVTVDGKSADASWDAATVATAASKADTVASFTVSGTADGAPISGTVINVPDGTTYFVDSGATTSTAEYDAVKAVVDDALLNQSADQQWNGTDAGETWGYSGGTGTGVIDGKSADNWLNTFVSADYDSKNGQITYHLTLKAGKYDIGAVQAPWKYPNGMYSIVTIGDQTIGARKVVSGLSDTNNSVVQSVEVAEDSVVDVTVGTEGNAGYNVRLAGLWAARTGDVAAADKTAPVFTGVDDVTVEFGASFDPLAGVSAKDDVDGDVTSAIKVEGDVDTSKAGSYTLTYTVSDKAGNTASATRVVTVKEKPVTPPADTEAPTFVGVDDVEITVGDAFDPLAGVIATDDVDGDLTKSIKVSGAVDTLKAGSYTLTYTVSDKAGNDATATRTVTVKEKPVVPPADTEAPTFAGVDDVEITVGATFDPLAGVTATDETDGDVTKSIKVEGTVDTSKAGTYTLTYTVSDKAGNTATAKRVVTVKEEPVTPPAEDRTAPVFSGVSDVTVEFGASFDPLAGISAKDDVDGDVTKSIKVEGSVDTSKAGEYTLTYRVSDKAGNTASATRVVTVKEKATEPSKDTVPPVFAGVNDVELTVGDAFDPLAGVSAKDETDGDVTKSIKVEGTVDTKTAGKYTLTYTVSDKAGNEATATRVVTVKEKPVTLPADDTKTDTPTVDTKTDTKADDGLAATGSAVAALALLAMALVAGGTALVRLARRD